jgi:hypothetical protein
MGIFLMGYEVHCQSLAGNDPAADPELLFKWTQIFFPELNVFSPGLHEFICRYKKFSSHGIAQDFFLTG